MWMDLYRLVFIIFILDCANDFIGVLRVHISCLSSGSEMIWGYGVLQFLGPSGPFAFGMKNCVFIGGSCCFAWHFKQNRFETHVACKTWCKTLERILESVVNLAKLGDGMSKLSTFSNCAQAPVALQSWWTCFHWSARLWLKSVNQMRRIFFLADMLKLIRTLI